MPQSCDDFTLHVSTPAGYGTDAHRSTIKVAWANTAADFDVYVLDSGRQRRSAPPPRAPTRSRSSCRRPAGDYTVRVVPYAPLGEIVQRDRDPGARRRPTRRPAPTPRRRSPTTPHRARCPTRTTPASRPSAPATRPARRSSSPTSRPTRSTSTTPSTPATRDLDRRLRQRRQRLPAGQHGQPRPDPVHRPRDRPDLRVAADRRGLAHLLHRRRRQDLEPQHRRRHPLRASTTRPSAAARSPPTASARCRPRRYPNAVYYCSQDIATAFCAVSRDGGTTFGAGVPTYSLLDCGGLHGHVKVAPDGTAYLPEQGLRRRPGRGRLQGQRHLAGPSPRSPARPPATPTRPWASAPTAPSTSATSAPTASPASRSAATRARPGPTGRPSAPSSASRTPSSRPWSPATTTAPSIAYLGTPTGGNYQDNANFHGVWHLYVDTTYDGGKTWVTSDATPNDPVQRRLDLHRRHHLRRRPQPARLHRRHHRRPRPGHGRRSPTAASTPASPTRSTSGRDAYATIARQSGGKTLFSEVRPGGRPTPRCHRARR